MPLNTSEEHVRENIAQARKTPLHIRIMRKRVTQRVPDGYVSQWVEPETRRRTSRAARLLARLFRRWR